METVEPIFMTSNTDTEAPMRPLPNIENLDPNLLKALSDKVEPIVAKPKTDIALPTRATCRNERELPKLL
jgi:hypothetical protein